MADTCDAVTSARLRGLCAQGEASDRWLATLSGWLEARWWRSQLGRAQKQLQECRHLYDFAPVGLVTLDHRGRIQQANQTAALFLGGTPSGLEGAPLVSRVAPDQVEVVLNRLWSYLSSELVQPWQLRLRCLDGTVRCFQVTGRRLSEERTAWVQLVFSDVTQEVHGREAVERTQALWRAALDSLQDGVLTTDTAGTIESANSAAEVMLGEGPAGLRGQSAEHLGILLRRDQYGSVVGWCSRRDGQPWLAEFTTSRLPTEGAVKLLVRIRDLTEVHRARQELEEIQERQRRTLGQELHDDLGQELTALAFVAEVLRGRLKDGGDELAALSSQVASLARQTIGKARALARGLYPTVLERNGLGGALRELASSTEEVYGVSCRLRADPLALSDSMALHFFRVAQEAVRNAIKHARPAQVRLELRGSAQRVWLEVCDDGCGLAARPVPSQGLGMRSMRHHAELMEGGLLVESQPGLGTRIHCWAPLEPRRVTPPAPISSPPPPPGPGPKR